MHACSACRRFDPESGMILIDAPVYKARYHVSGLGLDFYLCEVCHWNYMNDLGYQLKINTLAALKGRTR